ncbi:reverse transcriptase family protein [Winogradskyella sp.]|uniref:reverse transcriptase family protein n=1 Tax=Winogradskyella sp. TaxID=1883156 RepID=UPI003AB1C2EA
MKLEKKHTETIKNQFAQINSKKDIIDLINYVNQLVYGKDFKPLTDKGFNYYANPQVSKKRYKTFFVKKKSGGERIINSPVNGLKHILRPLNVILNSIAEPHHKAMGFVPNKSIVDNAIQHVNMHYVYNMDLKNFFHAFDRNRVKLGFMYPPFNLSGDLEPLAFLLASLCTHPFEIEGELKTVLPQGAPTSPTITNMLCVKLDRRLNGLAKRFNINYSRYADDITFSSQTNVFTKEEFLVELNRIIKDQEFEINPTKTRLQKTGYRKEVTGLVVNAKVNVNTRYIKQLRMWLYYWENYGYAKAEQIFRRDYAIDKGHVKKGAPSLENVLLGKLEYLKMVKGNTDPTYIKLYKRYTKLIGGKESCMSNNSSKKIEEKSQDKNLLQIVESIFVNGIEKAMDKY